MSSAVLFSGGMDSATLIADVKSNWDKDVVAVCFNYGQNHLHTEIAAQIALCNHFNVKRQVLVIDLRQIGGSPLTSNRERVPDASEKKQESTVVPMRNTILLSMAAAWSVTQGIDSLYFGACGDDQQAYPDCRPEFVDAIEALFRVAEFQSRAVRHVHAPYWNMSKADILQVGLKLAVPYELSHTCYNGLSPACGTCDACVERLRAFEEVGVKDPILYV